MSWLGRLLHRKRMEERLEQELQYHLDQHASELVEQGHDAAEARRKARLALGGPDQVKEQCRDARGTRWVEDFLQDVRYAVRAMGKNRGFAAIALCTLGLGIGATTVMFTLVDSVLLKPLAYPQSERLFQLQEHTEKPTQLGDLWAFSYANFLDCQGQSHSLEMAAWNWGGGTVNRSGDSEYADGREISAGLFSVLGIPVYKGRAFLPEEDKLGAPPVMIIGYGLWQRLFAGSMDAIGATLTLEGVPRTVVGIAPAGFQLAGEPDVFTPIGQDPAPRFRAREAHGLPGVVGRLRSGFTQAEAHAELAVIGQRLARQFPATNQGRDFVEEPLRQELVASVRPTLLLLLGAVSLVLLIACVNVASLLLARAVSRERELAMRAALGARRGRLVRQCITESAVLSLSGGAFGILLASTNIAPFVRLWPGGLPRAEEIHLDWRVLLFALGISLFTGLLFGLAPALRVPSRAVEQTLRSGGRAVAGVSRRLHSALVIGEIALAVVLLVSAGVLGRTLLRLASLDPGVDVHNLLVSRVALSPAALDNPTGTRAAWRDIMDRARAVPGVEAVSIVDTVPMRNGVNELGYWATPNPPPVNEVPVALATSVAPDYLRVMGLRLRSGRFFDDRDRAGSDLVIVIDEVMARRLFGGESAIGKRITVAGMGPGTVRIIGVVGHVRHWGLAGDDQASVRAQIYYAFDQLPDPLVRRWSELMSIAVRTRVEPLSILETLRRQVGGPAGDQVLYQARTMEELASASIARQRFLLLLFGTFAVLALVLACIGIYGVLAYLTRQRIPEIGVRMALGAGPADVLRMVLRQSLTMILAGSGAGIAGALAAASLLQRFVEGVRPAGIATYAAVLILLLAAALAASFLPARRASRIDPLTALRQE